MPPHPRALEGVAHDGEPFGKDPEVLPEERLTEEDVVEGVQSAVLQDNVLGCGGRVEQVEVAVLAGEVGVGLGFGDGCFGTGRGACRGGRSVYWRRRRVLLQDMAVTGGVCVCLRTCVGVYVRTYDINVLRDRGRG